MMDPNSISEIISVKFKPFPVQNEVMEARIKIMDITSSFAPTPWISSPEVKIDPVDNVDDDKEISAAEIIITSVSSLKCAICKRAQFKTTDALELHMEKVHKKSKRQCKICHRILASSRSLEKHLLTHTKNRKRFPCVICGHPFSTKTQASNCKRSHMTLAELQENEIFHLKCYFCQQIFFRNFNLKSHISIHTKEKPHFCPLCSKSYTCATSLKDHLRIAHGPKEKLDEIKSKWKYSCPVCHKKFRAPCNLEIHLPRHSTEKNFTCSSCDKSFKFRPELVAHKKIHEDDCPYACHQCGYRATSHWKLKQHLFTHTNKRPFICDLCPLAFKQNSNLENHKKVVHENKDVKPWSCTTCGKLFKEKSGLRNHEKLHNLEDIGFACETCGKKFVDQKRLGNHTRLHSGNRDFVCGYPGCGKSYTETSNLKRHQRVTHEEMRKYCKECGQGFTNARGLRYHLYAKHKIGKPLNYQTKKWGDLE